MIQVQNITKSFDGFRALDDLSFTVPHGAVYGLVGPNGAGKSTLIRAILGQRDYEGKITFHEASGKQTKLRIGYVPQSPAFDRGDPVSVMDLFTCCIFKRPAFLRPTKAMREKVLDCLANVHGEALIDKRIGTLSGGELQRVFLAQLFAQNPRLLLLDEPTNHLDLVYQKQIFSLVRGWLAKGDRAVVSVVHDLSLARMYGSRGVLLDRGKIAAAGKGADVFAPETLNAVYRMDVAGWMRTMLSQWDR